MKTKLFFLLFFNTFFSFYADAQSGEKLGNRRIEQAKPDLYIMCVGVTNDLQYPRKDAEDVLNTFRTQANQLFGAVHDTILTCNTKTGRSQIGNAIAKFKSKGIKKKDVLILFFSGHGKTTNAFGDFDFGFLGSDGLENDEYNLLGYKQDMVRHLDSVDCKKLIFIDACRSGAAKGQKGDSFSEIQNRISATPNSMITISSSSAEQSSYENQKWENGAFTKVLVEGLNGKADKDNNEYITIQELATYLIEGVPMLVKEIGRVQIPRIANFKENLVPKEYNFEIFNYKNKQYIAERKTDDCKSFIDDSGIKIKSIAIIGLKPNTTNKYDNVLSNITKSHLEEGEKGERKFSSITQAIKLAESGIADKLCNGGKVFIPAEYNPIDYFLVLKREPTSYEQNTTNQIWAASITLSYCYINTSSKEIEKRGQETITGADSLKSEAEKRAIERVLKVLNLKTEINETN